MYVTANCGKLHLTDNFGGARYPSGGLGELPSLNNDLQGGSDNPGTAWDTYEPTNSKDYMLRGAQTGPEPSIPLVQEPRGHLPRATALGLAHGP